MGTPRRTQSNFVMKFFSVFKVILLDLVYFTHMYSRYIELLYITHIVIWFV